MKNTEVIKLTLGLNVVAAVINIRQIHRREKWATVLFADSGRTFKNKISTFSWLLIVMDEKNLKIIVQYFLFLLYESLLERKTFTSSKINLLFQ